MVDRDVEVLMIEANLPRRACQFARALDLALLFEVRGFDLSCNHRRRGGRCGDSAGLLLRGDCGQYLVIPRTVAIITDRFHSALPRQAMHAIGIINCEARWRVDRLRYTVIDMLLEDFENT